MPTQTSVLLDAVGPQAGYGMPFGGMYSNVYGMPQQSQQSQDQYWNTLNRGYDNQANQLIRDAFGKVKTNAMSDEFDWSGAIEFDPATGSYRLDYNKLPEAAKRAANPAWWEDQFQARLRDPNEDRAQARQQLELVAQKRNAQDARTAQQQAENAGFQKELQRYNSPNLMAQMINPQIQNASNQVMAGANAAGMAGGSMGQAANRRAAMMGFGQGAANVVPQAAVQQAGQDFQWQKAREGVIGNYYQMQNARAQQDMQNQMALTGFTKGMEQYEHSRSREDLEAAGGFLQNMGGAAMKMAPSFGNGGGGGG